MLRDNYLGFTYCVRGTEKAMQASQLLAQRDVEVECVGRRTSWLREVCARKRVGVINVLHFASQRHFGRDLWVLRMRKSRTPSTLLGAIVTWPEASASSFCARILTQIPHSVSAAGHELRQLVRKTTSCIRWLCLFSVKAPRITTEQLYPRLHLWDTIKWNRSRAASHFQVLLIQSYFSNRRNLHPHNAWRQ